MWSPSAAGTLHSSEKFLYRLSAMAQNLSLGCGSDAGDPVSADSAYSSPSSSVSHATFASSAAAAATLTSVLCRLCNNLFSSPKILPCLHSFCSGCLEVYTGGAGISTCPLCRQEFTLPPSGAVGLPSDVSLANVMRTVPAQLQCFACKKPSALAVAKCINCASLMCQSCLGGHSFMECNEWSGEVEENWSASQDCPSHPGVEVDMYCCDCEQAVCSECICRREHRLISVEEAAATMAGLHAETRAHMGEMAAAVQFSEQSLVRLYNQFKEAERKIQETYDEFLAILGKHREDQMSQLESTYLGLHRRLTDTNRMSKEWLDRLTSLAEFYARIQKYAPMSERLFLKGRLEARSKQCTALVPQRVVCGVQFSSNPKTIHDGILNTFGYVAAQFEINGAPQIPGPYGPPARTHEGLNRLAEQLLRMNLEGSYGFERKPRLLAIESIPSMDNSIVSRIHMPLKSVIPRQQISYAWKFGAFGKMEGQFSEPNGVALNKDDDIIIADTNNNRVQLFNRSGKFKYQFGCLAHSDGQLLFPNRVAVTPGGDIVVTERAPTHQIQIYNQYGQFVRKFGSNILQFPRAVAVDKNNFIIVVECKIMRIVIFDQFGKPLHKFHCNQNLQFPNSVAVYNNEIFISDNRSHCVMVYDYEGTLVRQIGREGLTNYPIGVLVTADGHVLVADNHNNFNLTVFTTDGALVTAYESKVKHSQCYDVGISPSGVLALTCKDYHVYLYNYPMIMSGI